MKITEQKDPRYPIRVTFSDGRYLQLVLQRKLKKGSFLRKSGCSIISEYEALQWMGRHDDDIYPLPLYKWHKENTRSYIKGKLTIRGVDKGIDHFGKDLGTAKYYAPEHITVDKVMEELKKGNLIVFEHKAPHTFLLAWDDDKPWLLDKGKCRKANIPKLVKRKNKTKTYGGMVVVTPIAKDSKKKPVTKKTATKTTKKSTPAKKTNEQIAREVMDGKWGNDPERRKRLKAAGYDARAIQDIVNKLDKSKRK